MAADGEEKEAEAAGAPSDSRPQEQTFSGSHTTVTITTFESQFSKLGFATWKCAECGIWRVPGAPFCLSGEKAIFLGTCVLNDTSRLCCNCERQREQFFWRARCIQLYRRGERSEKEHIKLLAQPDRFVDVETQEVVWSSVPSADGEKPMEKFKEIMREAKPVDVGASRTAWYSNMSCNQCRRRVKLKAHDDIAKDKAIEMHEANLAHANAKGKKGKKKKK